MNFSGGDPPTLSHCPELRRLEIYTTVPEETERIVISSVISTNLRTIAFLPSPQGFTSYTLVSQPHYWEPLDDVACRLVSKLSTLGYKHTLELEFRFDGTYFDPDLAFGGFLPKFRERGRVKILNTSSGEFLDLAVRFFLRPALRCDILHRILVKMDSAKRGRYVSCWAGSIASPPIHHHHPVANVALLSFLGRRFCAKFEHTKLAPGQP